MLRSAIIQYGDCGIVYRGTAAEKDGVKESGDNNSARDVVNDTDFWGRRQYSHCEYHEVSGLHQTVHINGISYWKAFLRRSKASKTISALWTQSKPPTRDDHIWNARIWLVIRIDKAFGLFSPFTSVYAEVVVLSAIKETFRERNAILFRHRQRRVHRNG